jgi:transposase
MVNTHSKKQEPLHSRYSISFKQLVVDKYESGKLNKDQLQRKYGIRGNDFFQSWLRKYGKLVYPKHKSIGRPMKDQDQQRIKKLEAELKQENKALEKKLKAVELELAAYNKFIEIAELELHIEI